MLLIELLSAAATEQAARTYGGFRAISADGSEGVALKRTNSCWMDKDMPSRSQGGIEVAPQAPERATASWWLMFALVMATRVAVSAAEPSPQDGDTLIPAATIMESLPAQSEGDVSAAAVVVEEQTQSLSAEQVQEVDDLHWDSAQAAEEMSMLPLIAKVIVGLGLVVGLAWGSVWLLRRTTLGQGAVGAGSIVKVVERTWLGPKKAIFLVDISGRTLALGVTDEQISVLSAWEKGEIDVTPAPKATPGAFAIQLKSLLTRGNEVKVGA